MIFGEKLGIGWLSQSITRMKCESLEDSRAVVCCQTWGFRRYVSRTMKPTQRQAVDMLKKG